jgi:opacity protein-like surface antigen
MMERKKLELTLAVTAILVLSSALAAQAVQKPVYAGYRGVMVGMPMADARTKLGNAKDKSDAEDYYVYGDNESAQVLYGADKTVRVISINYIGKNAPSPMDILGTAVEAKPDGSMNKMVRYPKSGFWISYLKTGGDDPMVVVTVQKMAVEQ